ncbi:hypothetical protein RHGRI_035247 [Rhododendron griersonianum]|uniref:Uncharacterized protein n=1 Tax=Rhododendron griersonianum TaxID=479676 RepID=A0AAV6I3U3_9ERIC|nr:hypothetical protein RHGRI_035247 [Rhododendron griersonianum]
MEYAYAPQYSEYVQEQYNSAQWFLEPNYDCYSNSYNSGWENHSNFTRTHQAPDPYYAPYPRPHFSNTSDPWAYYPVSQQQLYQHLAVTPSPNYSIDFQEKMLQALDEIDIAISRCEGKISSIIEQVVDMEYREDAWDVEKSITNSEDSKVEELLLSKVSHTPREEEQIEPIVVIEGVDLDLEKDLESELNNELNIQSSPQDDSTCTPDTPFQSKTLEESLPIIVQSPLELDDQVQPVVGDATPPIEPPPLSNFHKVEPIDFLGADNFDLFFHPCLDIVNNLKINLVRITCLVELKFLKRLMQLRYSKYLILWHGRVQFLKESSKGGEMFIFVTLHGVVEVPNSRECGTFFLNYF